MDSLNDIADLIPLAASTAAAVAIGHGAYCTVWRERTRVTLAFVHPGDATRLRAAGWNSVGGSMFALALRRAAQTASR